MKKAIIILMATTIAATAGTAAGCFKGQTGGGNNTLSGYSRTVEEKTADEHLAEAEGNAEDGEKRPCPDCKPDDGHMHGERGRGMGGGKGRAERGNGQAMLPHDGADGQAMLPHGSADGHAMLPPDGAEGHAMLPPDGADGHAMLPPDGGAWARHKKPVPTPPAPPAQENGQNAPDGNGNGVEGRERGGNEQGKPENREKTAPGKGGKEDENIRKPIPRTENMPEKQAD